MVPVLVFFGVATLVGGLILVFVRLRLRAVARRPDASDAEVCELQHANRISSAAVVAAVIGLVVVAVLFVVI